MSFDEFIELLKSTGLEHWVRTMETQNCRIVVRIDNDVSSEHDAVYIDWCNKNCESQFFVYNEHYVLFKIEEDAMAFKLRWT